MRRFALFSVFIIPILILLMLFYYPTSKTEYDHNDTIADQAVWNLKLGHNMPVNSALHEAAVLYAKSVEKKSQGRIHITIYPNQELGSDPKMIEMARRGTLDIILIPTAKMGAAMPSMQYVDLPFYFPTREDTYAMLDGEPGQMLLDQLKQINLIGVTFWENGFKHFTANTPLHSPDDFKGKKFRIMESRLIQSQFEALGAKTYAIDFHKVRQALAEGVVDGQENPLVAIRSMGIDKVQKHLTLSSHGYMGYVFCISEKTFQTLPTDFQKILYSTAREITPYEREQTHKREAKLLKEMENEGIIIHTLNPKERSEFSKKMAVIVPYYEEVIGAHILAKTQEILINKYGPSSNNCRQIAIGLSTDLSVGSKIGGMAIKRGIELAIEDINARGGVLGKTLVLITKDNRGLSSKGVDDVRELIACKNLVAIFGGVKSAIAHDSISEAQKAGIPFLIAWASGSELTKSSQEKNVVFRVSANNREVMYILEAYLRTHYHKPTVMYENSIWGRDALNQIKAIAAKRNLPIHDAIIFNIGQTNFEKEIDQLNHSQSDSILLIANSAESIKIIKALDRHKLYLPIVSHWGITSDHFFEITKNELQRIPLYFFQTFSFKTSSMPKSKLLSLHYMRHYGLTSPESIDAPSAVAQAYDMTNLLVLAIQKAGSTDRSKVRDALENLGNYEGVVRRYNRPFTSTDHEGLSEENYMMARYRQDGAIIPITDH